MFVTSSPGVDCKAYGKTRGVSYGEFYYWLSFIVNFVFPFIILLAMNSVIIQTLRVRSSMLQIKISDNQSRFQGQGQSEGQVPKMKTSERQIYVTLLVVTFRFLILSTPPYVYVLIHHVMAYDTTKSANLFAAFYLFYQVAQKSYYTNYGINFFLYVASGQKFRTDLTKLFSCPRKELPTLSGTDSNSFNTVDTTI